MDTATASKVIDRVIAEVAGTLLTNGIRELDSTERGGMSDRIYVRSCIVGTAYNAVRAYPGFAMSYNEFWRAVETAEKAETANG